MTAPGVPASLLALLIALLNAGLAAGDEALEVEPAVCDGSVRVFEGSPEGAEVIVIPSDAALELLGLELPSIRTAAPTGVFPRDARPVTSLPDWAPRTTVGADGSFSLEFPHAFGITNESRFWGGDIVTVLVRHRACATTVIQRGIYRRDPDGAARLHLGMISMPREGRLAGRAVDEDGRPVAGVVVRRWPRGDSLNPLYVLERSFPPEYLEWDTTQTRADGRFELVALEPAPGARELELSLDHRSFRPLRVPFAPVASGELQDLGDIVLTRGDVLTGRVTDIEGMPVVGARLFSGKGQPMTVGRAELRVFPDDDTVLHELLAWQSTADRAITDTAGRYTLSGIPADHDVLYVAADGYEPVRVPWELATDIVLPPEGQVLVRLVDGITGQAIRNATLRAWRPAAEDFTQYVAELPVDVLPDGRHRVHRVGRVATRLELTAPGYGTQVESCVGLAPGDVRELVLSMPPEAVLAGRLVDVHGKPVAGETVQLYQATPWPLGLPNTDPSARTDEHGGWRVSGLPAGTVTVHVRDKAYAKPDVHMEVVLAAGETRDLLLEQQEYAALRVEVIGADGRPTPGVTVQANTAAGARSAAPAVTGEDGVVTLRTAPGRHSLVVDTAEVVDVVLGSGGQRTVIVTLGSAPTLVLRLTSGGVPVAREHMRLMLLDADEPLSVLCGATDADGRTRATLPRVGRWEVRSAWCGWVLGVVEAARGGRLAEDLVLPVGRIEGVVVDEHGDPVPRALITLMRDEQLLGQQSTADGRFHLPRLQPGTYRVEVTGSFLPAAREVEVTSEATADPLRIEVQQGAVVRGRVVGAPCCSDAPAAGRSCLVQVISLASGEMACDVPIMECAFDIAGLPSGDYRLDVMSVRFRGGHQSPLGTRRLVASTEVSLDDATVQEVEIVLPPD